jgi:hypothetical protein
MHLSTHIQVIRDMAGAVLLFYVLFRLDLFRRQLNKASEIHRARGHVRDRGLTVYALLSPTSVDPELLKSLATLAANGEFVSDRHGTVWGKARPVDARKSGQELFVYIGLPQPTEHLTSEHIPRASATLQPNRSI